MIYHYVRYFWHASTWRLSAMLLSFCLHVSCRAPADDELIRMLNAPVYADPSHITTFFTQQFQHSAYSRLILPACLDHLAQLLSYAPVAQNPLEYTCTILHIFTQRLRATAWLEPVALLIFLQKTQDLISQLTVDGSYSTAQERIADLLYERLYQFVDRYMLPGNSINSYMQDNRDYHRQTPYLRALQVIDEQSINLAQAITDIVRQCLQHDQLQEVRHAWATFLDVALSRLIWSPAMSVDSWRSTCALADQLIISWENYSLPSAARLNDLLWALVTRYGYFCELMYCELSTDLLQSLHAYLRLTEPTWLIIPEQDPLMLTKRDYLKNLIFELAVEKELEQSLPTVQAP
jgi:hypothetical protein